MINKRFQDVPLDMTRLPLSQACVMLFMSLFFVAPAFAAPSADVPEELAGLVPDHALVIAYIPSVEQAVKELGELAGDAAPPLPPASQLFDNVFQTTLTVPANEPILGWLVSPTPPPTPSNPSPAGFVYSPAQPNAYFAMKIPGATSGNIRPASRDMGLTVLDNGIVVVSQNKAVPYLKSEHAGQCHLFGDLQSGILSIVADIELMMSDWGPLVESGMAAMRHQVAKESNAENAQQISTMVMNRLLDCIKDTEMFSMSIDIEKSNLIMEFGRIARSSRPKQSTGIISSRFTSAVGRGYPMYMVLDASLFSMILNLDLMFEKELALGFSGGDKRVIRKMFSAYRDTFKHINGGAAIGFGYASNGVRERVAFGVDDSSQFFKKMDTMFQDLSASDIGVTVTAASPQNQSSKREWTMNFGKTFMSDLAQGNSTIQTMLDKLGSQYIINGEGGSGLVVLDAHPAGDTEPQTKANILQKLPRGGWGKTTGMMVMDLRSLSNSMHDLFMDMNFPVPTPAPGQGPPAIVSMRMATKDREDRLVLSCDVKGIMKMYQDAMMSEMKQAQQDGGR